MPVSALPASLKDADRVFCYAGNLDWDAATAQSGDHVLVMSNGGFGGIHTKLLQQLA